MPGHEPVRKDRIRCGPFRECARQSRERSAFIKKIAEGGPVAVTDPEMSRHFMTLLEAGVLGKGGELILLDMGNLRKNYCYGTKYDSIIELYSGCGYKNAPVFVRKRSCLRSF